MHGWIKKSKPEETTILRSRSAIFVSRWGRHEGSKAAPYAFLWRFWTQPFVYMSYISQDDPLVVRENSPVQGWLPDSHTAQHIIFTSLPHYLEDGAVPCLWRFLALNIAGKDRNCTTTVNALQSNLDYPDLDYPDFSIIQSFSLVQILSWILIRRDEDP